MYELSTEYWFDSAHFLTDYNGKCENLHGHQWRVTAYVRASELGASGTEKDMVVDFATLKRIVREECDALDHTFLVEEGSLAPATMDALAAEGFSLTAWIATRLPTTARPSRLTGGRLKVSGSGPGERPAAHEARSTTEVVIWQTARCTE